MKVYLNKEYKCVKVEDNTFVANDSSNYIRYYFVTNANGVVIDKMDDTSVIYKNTEPSYVTVAFRRADGDVIQHLMASPTTDSSGVSYFEYIITDTDGVLYKKGALEISAQFIDATISEKDGVKKVISQRVKAIAINTAHVLDNIGEEAEEYYSQYEQANNEAHAVLQSQITKNFNNIGTLQDLTTENKDDLVKAINEVDAHADANKSEIGDLSNLTTDEKTTIVGAINEVDEHANTAQQTADNATELANTGISKAEQAQATANTAVNTANEAKTKAQTAENNANSAVDKANNAVGKANEAIMKADAKATSIGFMTAKDAVTALNGYPRNQLKGGDTIWIVEAGTPDLWVTEVAQESVPYNYTTKDKFNQDLVDNKVLQIGYFKTAYQESDGKPVTIAWQNVSIKTTDWVASTEFADFPYEAKIELTDFVDYKTVPQVVFDIADTMSGNYAPICKSGDKCVYIYGKVNTAITLKTVITFAPNVNGASVTGGGYNNRGKWVASTTYEIDDLVYTDKGQYVCIEGITSTTSPDNDTTHWQASFVATAGTTENGLKISGQNGNGTEVQKTFDGSQAVEMAFDENDFTLTEKNGVLEVKTNATVPEALPQEASALKSGNLPTTGWTNVTAPLWQGVATFDKNGGNKTLLCNIGVKWNNRDEMPLTGWAIEYSYIGDDNRYTITTLRKDDSVSKNGIFYGFGSGGSYPYLEIDVNGNVYGWTLYTYISGRTIYKIEQQSLSKQGYTISDTSITANSDILMELTDDGGVKAYSMEAGKITVIRDTVPTQPIPYTYKVKQTNASGQFTVLNHFVPSIPESPTSLPVTYKKVSGELPITGWGTLDEGWKQNTLPASRKWASVTYGDDKYVAVAENSSAGAYSTDGVSWTEIILPASRDWRSVTYGDGKFVAIAYGSGNGAYSTNGINWTEMSMPAGANWIGVTYGHGKFVAITRNNAYAAYSTNGITWMNTTLPTDVEFSSVTYGNGKFVAVASSSGGKGAYSTDGITWTEMTVSVDYRTWQSVTYGNGKFVAVPINGNKGAYSTDGIAWTEMTVSITSRSWYVTYGNGKFVAVANNSGEVSYSTNGISWSTTTTSESRSWRAVTYGNGKFVAIAYNDLYGAYWKAAADVTYTISDTSITANTSVKMYLTDAGGTKAHSKANGSITVIRDTVPTNAIPYEYEVEQTSAEGLFEVINAYVPSVPTKTSDLTNDSGFIKPTEANTFTGEQTFSNANGIKTNRIHNLNGNAWYDFDGTNDRLGSLATPTIIRTSEARPKAEVPSGSGAAIKELALLEDVQGAGEWVSVTGETATLTQAGTYQFIFTDEALQSIMYWDGATATGGITFVALRVINNLPEVISFFPRVSADGSLRIDQQNLLKENDTWKVKTTFVSGFKYRKIN